MNDDPFPPPERLSCWVGIGNFLLGIAIAHMLVAPKAWTDYHQMRHTHYDGPRLDGLVFIGIFCVFIPIAGSIIGTVLVAVAHVLHKRNIAGWPRFFSVLGWIGLPAYILIILWEISP